MLGMTSHAVSLPRSSTGRNRGKETGRARSVRAARHRIGLDRRDRRAVAGLLNGLAASGTARTLSPEFDHGAVRRSRTDYRVVRIAKARGRLLRRLSPGAARRADLY